MKIVFHILTFIKLGHVSILRFVSYTELVQSEGVKGRKPGFAPLYVEIPYLSREFGGELRRVESVNQAHAALTLQQAADTRCIFGWMNRQIQAPTTASIVLQNFIDLEFHIVAQTGQR